MIDVEAVECAYLCDAEAVDVSRMTDIPISLERLGRGEPRRPYMDLTQLSWWDRFRVAWCLLGGYAYLGKDM